MPETKLQLGARWALAFGGLNDAAHRELGRIVSTEKPPASPDDSPEDLAHSIEELEATAAKGEEAFARLIGGRYRKSRLDMLDSALEWKEDLRNSIHDYAGEMLNSPALRHILEDVDSRIIQSFNSREIPGLIHHGESMSKRVRAAVNAEFLESFNLEATKALREAWSNRWTPPVLRLVSMASYASILSKHVVGALELDSGMEGLMAVAWNNTGVLQASATAALGVLSYVCPPVLELVPKAKAIMPDLEAFLVDVMTKRLIEPREQEVALKTYGILYARGFVDPTQAAFSAIGNVMQNSIDAGVCSAAKGLRMSLAVTLR